MDTLMPKLPWDIHPALTEDRLRLVAAIAVRVRREVMRRAEPSKGDNAWNLGCDAFARTRHAIWGASQGGLKEWLSVIDPSMHFVFGIGGVPVRIYRGDADDRAPHNYLQRTYPELEAQQLAFSFLAPAEMDPIMRLAVEVDELGYVSAVTILQVDMQGNPHNPWRVPLDGALAVSTSIARKPGVELSAPEVGSLGETKQRATERGA